MKIEIEIEAETSYTEDDQLVQDTIEVLETLLPYMWDNVIVKSKTTI